MSQLSHLIRNHEKLKHTLFLESILYELCNAFFRVFALTPYMDLRVYMIIVSRKFFPLVPNATIYNVLVHLFKFLLLEISNHHHHTALNLKASCYEMRATTFLLLEHLVALKALFCVLLTRCRRRRKNCIPKFLSTISTVLVSTSFLLPLGKRSLEKCVILSGFNLSRKDVQRKWWNILNA